MANICLINSLFTPLYRGGAEVVTQTIAFGLAKRGHRVTVITLGKTPTKRVEQGVTVYTIKPWNVFSFIDINERPIWLRVFWHPLDVYSVSSRKQIQRILEREKPDVVMTHNLKGLGYLIPGLIRRLSIFHIHTAHDVQLSRPSGLLLYGQEKPFLIIDKFYEKVCQKLFGSPDVVITPSEWLQKYYRRRGFFRQSNCVVMPNPVTFEKIDHIAQPTGNSRVIELLYVGGVQAYKGVLLLLRSVKKLTEQNWRLTIVGDGRDLAEAQAMVQGDPRIVFRGRLEREKLPALYRQCDITIVPSLCYENSPTVIYESLVANVPVIAADIGGVAELIKDNSNGLTFAAGDEENLRQTISHVLRHPELIEQLRKNAFASVRNYSLESYLKQLLSLIPKKD